MKPRTFVQMFPEGATLPELIAERERLDRVWDEAGTIWAFAPEKSERRNIAACVAHRVASEVGLLDQYIRQCRLFEAECAAKERAKSVVEANKIRRMYGLPAINEEKAFQN